MAVIKSPKTVAEYISATPRDARKKLREMRSIIRSAAPGATEGLKWGMPGISYKRILVMYAAFKDHVSFFPTSSAIREFKAGLRKYATSAGTIQFPLGKPLPRGLIRKITLFRVRESRTLDGKWRS